MEDTGVGTGVELSVGMGVAVESGEGIIVAAGVGVMAKVGVGVDEGAAGWTQAINTTDKNVKRTKRFIRQSTVSSYVRHGFKRSELPSQD